MGHTSNDLLHLEHKASSSFPLVSTLLVCKNGSESKLQNHNHPRGKSITIPLPSSQVMGKVKDFLGVISEANKRLELDAKDLMLGIADLNTPEAVAAAEYSIAGFQSESEDSSSDDDDDNDNDKNGDQDNNNNEAISPVKHKRSKSSYGDSSGGSEKQQRLLSSHENLS